MRLITHHSSLITRGQSLVEIVIAIGLTSILLPALLTGFVASREGKAQETQRIQATALLKEANEAVRSIREKGWVSIATNNTYYPYIDGSTWSLSTSPSYGSINGFTRKIVITDAQRNSNGNIVQSGGTPDTSTKKVVSTVSWTTPISSSINSTNYFQRYLGNNAFSHTTQNDFNGGSTNNTVVTNGGPSPTGAVELTQTPSSTVDFGNKFQAIATSSIGNMTSSAMQSSMRFTAQSTKTVSAVRVYIHARSNPSPTYRFGIQNNNNSSNLPLGTYLGSGTLAPSCTSCWVTISLSPSVSITKNSTYHLVVQYESGTISASRYIGLRQTGPQTWLYPFNNTQDLQSNTLFNSGSGWAPQNYQPMYELDFSDSTYEGNPYESGTTASIYGNNCIGEKFTVTSGNKTITKISFYVSKNSATNPSDSLQIELRDSNNSTVESGILATAAQTTTTYQYFTYTFSTQRTLVNGATYRIFLKSPGSNSTNYYRVYYLTTTNSTNYNSITYDGTNSVYTVSSNSGSTWTDTNVNWDIGGYYFTVQIPTSYTSGGDFIGSFDGGHTVAFNNIIWTAQVPPNTNLKFRIALSDTDSGPLVFVGPDGTINSYYTASSAITPFSQVTGRYIHYIAFFTSDGTATPTLSDVSINYSP